MQGVELKSSTINKVQRLLRQIDKAKDNNPYALPAMTSPPTVTVSATSDSELGTAVALAASNALTSAGLNQVAYYGGIPKASGKYILMPVASLYPSTGGNLAGYANANITTDMSAWCYAEEIETDATTVEFGLFMNNAMRVMVQVDGQYVDKTGWVGAGSSGADNYLKLVFASRKVRRIRLMHGLRTGNASGSMLFQVRLTTTLTFWRPSQAGVTALHWFGDSYGEGQNTAFMLPNGPMAQIAGELLGFRNVYQRSVGQTGYINAGGTRSKLRDQLPRILDTTAALYAGADPDLVVIPHGYNDYTSAAADITAEAVLAYQAIRSYTKAPIVVLGAQAGRRGPDATTLAVEAAIQAAVTQFNDPYCKFRAVSSDASPWLYGTGYVGSTNASGNSDVYVSSDATHPSDAGHEYLGYRAAGAIHSALKAMG